MVYVEEIFKMEDIVDSFLLENMCNRLYVSFSFDLI